VRFYLRQLGELDMSKFHIEYEDGRFEIDWNYDQHTKPTAEDLSGLKVSDIAQEKNRFYQAYTSDIYTFEGDSGQIPLTAVRQLACSASINDKIQLTKLGFYRVTFYGKCFTDATEQFVEITVKQTYKVGGSITVPTVIYHTDRVSRGNFTIVCLVEPRGLNNEITLNLGAASNSRINGNILVEWL